jgi:4-hydroxy-tetrahydrodipicolinate synthase
MDDSGNVAYDALGDHIERLEAAGVHGIIPCGSTGERATLTRTEHERVIETTVEAASTPVLAGTGASSTREAIELSKDAESAGADGVLVIYPYYSWPSNEHVINHYEAIADAVDIPLVIYNIPKRTARNLEPEATVQLAEHPNIAGIKESAGDINQIYELLQRTRRMDFDVLSGYDSQAISTLPIGGTGITSVAANVFPGTVCDLYEAAKGGNRDRARELHEEILEIEAAMNLQTIPVAVKAALDIIGVHEAHVRPPLYEASMETRRELEEFISSRDPA